MTHELTLVTRSALKSAIAV